MVPFFHSVRFGGKRPLTFDISGVDKEKMGKERDSRHE